MKKICKVLIILTIAVLCLMYTKIISNAQTAVIITETLRLRKEATTNSSILELISEDEKVEVLGSGYGDDGQWYKVVYKGITGYVYGEYIKLLNNTNSNENITSNENNTTSNNTASNNTTLNNTTSNNITSNNEEENIVENNNTVENNIQTNTIEQPNENNEPTTEPENTEPTEPEVKPEIKINVYKTVSEEQALYIVPLINASKINTIKANEKVYVIQVLNGWAYISSDNTSGWVRYSNLIDAE